MMKRIALVFPAPANPTYVPIGIAALAGYLRQSVSGCQVKCFDLNISAWERLVEHSSAGLALVHFLKGREGNFFDEAKYLRNLMIWSELNGSLTHLSKLAKEHIENNAIPQDLDNLLVAWTNEVFASDPEVIGISVMYLQQLYLALAFAKRVKEVRPQVQIVLGGAALSVIDAAALLKACSFLDLLVLGEGELAIAEIALGKGPREIPGAVYREGTAVLHNPSKCLATIHQMAAPDFSDFDLTRYFSPLPVLPALFSRGCRWRRCRFCAHNFSWGRYRSKGAEEFVDELETYVKQYSVQHFYFADQYIDAADLESISEALIERNLKIYWHVMGKPVKNYTKEVLQEMYAAGCRWISWGVETGSQRLLDLIDKGTKVEEIREVIIDTAEAGISNLMMMIFGLPTSTDEDLQETFRLIESVYDKVDALTSSSFMLFDHTPFARHPERYGLQVTGCEPLLTVRDVIVNSDILHFKEAAADGSWRKPRGPLEVAEWSNRRLWLGDIPIWEHLPAEHYLLYTSVIHASPHSGDWPDGPRTRAS